jgi:GGDEF domain-containing protein
MHLVMRGREFIADLLAQPRGCRRSLRVARDADQALYSAKNSGRDRVAQMNAVGELGSAQPAS